MTENNKAISNLLEALHNKDKLQLKGDNQQLENLEEAIFIKDNLEHITADEGTDLGNFLKGTVDIGSIKDPIINNPKNNTPIINNGHMIEDGTIILFYTRFLSKANFHVLHEGAHYKTVDINNNTIFDSLEDGRQPINPTTHKAEEQGCGIHAIEGVLIAKKLAQENKDIAKFKALTKTSDEDLLEQRKILFKMEILDTLNSSIENGNIERVVLDVDKINNLYNLYFEEFKARCAAYQNVLKELNQENKKEETPKVEEKKEEKEKQNNNPAAPQQIKQEKKLKQQKKPIKHIVIESPIEDTQNKQEEPIKNNKLQYEKTIAENSTGDINDKKFALPTEPEQPENDTPTESNSSVNTQTSNNSTTSSILSQKCPKECPNIQSNTVYDWGNKRDTKMMTYEIKDNKPNAILNIDDKAAELYFDILMQVIKETSKNGNLETITKETIDLIRKQTEDKVDACFTIRDENNNIIKDLTNEDEDNLKLAKDDYKARANKNERIINIFDQLGKLKNLQGAEKEIKEKFFQQTIASKE